MKKFGTHQLDGYHEDSLQGKGPVTKVKEVLQAGSQQLQNHGVVLPTWAEVEHLWYTFG